MAPQYLRNSPTGPTVTFLLRDLDQDQPYQQSGQVTKTTTLIWRWSTRTSSLREDDLILRLPPVPKASTRTSPSLLSRDPKPQQEQAPPSYLETQSLNTRTSPSLLSRDPKPQQEQAPPSYLETQSLNKNKPLPPYLETQSLNKNKPLPPI